MVVPHILFGFGIEKKLFSQTARLHLCLPSFLFLIMVGSPTLFKDWFLQLWPKFTKSAKNYSDSVGSSHIEAFVKNRQDP